MIRAIQHTYVTAAEMCCCGLMSSSERQIRKAVEKLVVESLRWGTMSTCWPYLSGESGESEPRWDLEWNWDGMYRNPEVVQPMKTRLGSWPAGTTTE